MDPTGETNKASFSQATTTAPFAACSMVDLAKVKRAEADAEVVELTRKLAEARRRAMRAARELALARHRAGEETALDLEVPSALGRFHSAPVAASQRDNAQQSLIAEASWPQTSPEDTAYEWYEINKLFESQEQEKAIQQLLEEREEKEEAIQQLLDIMEEQLCRITDDASEQDFSMWRPHWFKRDGLREVLVDGMKEKKCVEHAFMKTLTEHSKDNPKCICVAPDMEFSPDCPVAEDEDFVVCKIERIHNIGLWNMYEALKNNMLNEREYRRAHYDVERKWLFHGTDERTAAEIAKGNFNRSFAGKNATRYGHGSYFAVNSSYSADKDLSKKEKYSVPNEDGLKVNIMCRVLVGDFCRGFDQTQVPDYMKGGSRRFDSTVDNVENPTIFVTYNDAQVYPEYIVTFRDKRPPPPPPACTLSPPPVISPRSAPSPPGRMLGDELAKKLEQRRRSRDDEKAAGGSDGAG